MLTKELLRNVVLFLERTPCSGAKEAYALAEAHSVVMDEIKLLETPPAPKGEVK